MNTTYTPSKYQTAIFDFVKNQTGHAVVEARAGSGKTSTIVDAMGLLGPFDKAVFLAFNKHIADELATRNVPARTLNSFGWECVRNHYRKRIKLNANKTKNILKYKIFDMEDETQRKKCYSVMHAVCRLVGLIKANTAQAGYAPVTAWGEYANKHGIELPDKMESGEFAEILIETFDLSIEQTTVMDFDDQIFMPIYAGMSSDQFTFVFVDEAQDLNPVQFALVKKMVGEEGRVIAVGDSYQAIYGFRGADPDSIQNMVKGLDAKVLPLSICYRCPKAIVQEAQTIVRDIEWADGCEEGKVEDIETVDFIKQAEDGDYVLCRTTAPLVKRCLQMIREGKKATIKGRDIGTSIKELIAKIATTGHMPVDGFLTLLQEHNYKERDRLTKRGRDAELMALDDRVQTIEALSEKADVVNDIYIRIDKIFTENLEGVVFSTIHKSKGLEAPRIFILRPDKLPHPMAKKPWQQKQEQNLKYVAITRAQSELYWVNPEKGER